MARLTCLFGGWYAPGGGLILSLGNCGDDATREQRDTDRHSLHTVCFLRRDVDVGGGDSGKAKIATGEAVSELLKSPSRTQQDM